MHILDRHGSLRSLRGYKRNRGRESCELSSAQRTASGYHQNNGNHSVYRPRCCRKMHRLHFQIHGQRMFPKCQHPRPSNDEQWLNLSILRFGLPCKTLLPQAPELIQARFLRNRMLLPIGYRLHLFHCHLAVVFVECRHCSSFLFCYLSAKIRSLSESCKEIGNYLQ